MMGAEESKPTRFNALVAYVTSARIVVINRGKEHGVELGQRFVVYTLSDEEIKDPATGKSLGRLEIFKGTGTVIHVQNSMATVEADRLAPVRKRLSSELTAIELANRSAGRPEQTVRENDVLPFDSPQVGDYAKPVSIY